MRLAIFALTLCGVLALGQEKTIHLPPDNAASHLAPGTDADLTRNHCIICHSTDYIVRQPRSDAKQWEAEVQKMVRVYGAPASEDDVRRIAAYLAAAYGR